ncbi:MAG: metallophosphoesterase family protein [Limisphaerales bacterium]
MPLLNFLNKPKTLSLQPERILAVGDVHGCAKALKRLTEVVNPTERDLLVYLGDYVDKGPDSTGVLDFIIAQAKRQPVVCLRGNHEMMMLRSRRSRFEFQQWQAAGGWETLLAYGLTTESGWKKLIPPEHWQFILDTEEWMETDHHILVHAGIDPDRALEKQAEEDLYWNHNVKFPLHRSGKKTIIGHTRLKSGVPLQFKGGVCVDTGVADGGWLTCLNIETGTYWQSNEDKDIRSNQLRAWGDPAPAEASLDEFKQKRKEVLA